MEWGWRGARGMGGAGGRGDVWLHEGMRQGKLRSRGGVRDLELSTWLVGCPFRFG